MKQAICVVAVFLVLVLLSVVALADHDEAFSDKQWSNTLLLEGKSGTIVKMLMSLPSEPVSVDSSGEAVIHDAYFHRENDRGGNPNLGVLIQVSEAQLMTYSVIYNANQGKKK